MANIFLTGSTGFIGANLMPKLQALGYEVITNLRYLGTEKFECVIHLAAVTHIKTEFDGLLLETNINLTKKMLRTPNRTLYASSCSAKYLTNPYAYTKRYSEFCGSKHVNALGFRFHNVYGPGNNKGIVWWLLQQPSGARINVRGPELVRDYIHLDDVTDEIIVNLHSGTGVIDVGTGKGTQTMDLVNLYMKLSGKEFIIDVSEAGENEPASMISDRPILAALDLETGLKKTIEQCAY